MTSPHSSDVRLEFTVEPFVDGQPGAHVLAAWAAVETAGYPLDNGPFSASVTTQVANVGDVTRQVVDASMAHGATRVSIVVERDERRESAE